MPGFAMVVGKSGSKMREAKGDEVVLSFGGAGKPRPDGPGLIAARIAEGAGIVLSGRFGAKAGVKLMSSRICHDLFPKRTGVYLFLILLDGASGDNISA